MPSELWVTTYPATSFQNLSCSQSSVANMHWLVLSLKFILQSFWITTQVITSSFISRPFKSKLYIKKYILLVLKACTLELLVILSELIIFYTYFQKSVQEIVTKYLCSNEKGTVTDQIPCSTLQETFFLILCWWRKMQQHNKRQRIGHRKKNHIQCETVGKWARPWSWVALFQSPFLCAPFLLISDFTAFWALQYFGLTPLPKRALIAVAL